MKVKVISKNKKLISTSSRIAKKNEALFALRGIWKNKDLSWRKSVSKSWATWSRSF